MRFHDRAPVATLPYCIALRRDALSQIEQAPDGASEDRPRLFFARADPAQSVDLSVKHLATHPRRKNDESVPKSNRSLPTTSSARLKTVGRSTGAASYFIHLFELEVST